jgi:hypothetical protein
MPDKKNRIVVPIGKRDRQIFSVTERKNGDLLVALRVMKNFEHPARGDVELREMRFSLHRSPQSEIGGRTYKNTTVLKDGTEIDMAAFVLPSMEDRYFPVFGHRVQDLKRKKYDPSSGALKDIVRLPKYNIEKQTLVYVLYASPPEAQDVEIPPYQTIRLKYEFWKLHICLSYIRIATVDSADVLTSTTSGVRENKEFQFRRESEGTAAFAFEDLPKIHQHYLSDASRRIVWRSSREMQARLMSFVALYRAAFTYDAGP